jgi:hypothetical protein
LLTLAKRLKEREGDKESLLLTLARRLKEGERDKELFVDRFVSSGQLYFRFCCLRWLGG